MPVWSEIFTELLATGQPPHLDFDGIRRKYLLELNNHTRRNVVLYASGWLQKGDAPSILISDEDIHALMEVTSGLNGGELDLILHSPGGSPNAAEAIVSYLRSRFSHIRVIVPLYAKSAAAMISCAADEIVLGKHSFLGPTDPQILLTTALGFRPVPAQAVLDQFDKAQKECSDPKKLPAWVPMLSQYGPDFLIQCERALALSKELVRTWLEAYMFKDCADGPEKARVAAKWLADHKNFKSHGRHISQKALLEHGLRVTELEDDPDLQDLSLSVFHATTHTFSLTPIVKIVESHTGHAFIQHYRPPPSPQQAIQVDLGIAPDQPM